MAVNSYREDEFMENTDKKKIFRRLFSYLLEYKAILIGVLFCMAVTVVISLVNPLLIEEAIDHYIANKDMRGLMGLGLFALGLNIIFIIMVKIRMYVMAVVSNKILLRTSGNSVTSAASVRICTNTFRRCRFLFLTADRPERFWRESSAM